MEHAASELYLIFTQGAALTGWNATMQNRPTDSDSLMTARRRIRWLLTAGAVLLLVFVVSGSLALILSAGGDDVGVSGVLGIVYVTGVGLFLDAVALLIVTSSAVNELIDQRTAHRTSSVTRERSSEPQIDADPDG